MSVSNHKTQHDKLVDILFNTPETPEQIRQKKILMILRIKHYYYQKKKYIDNNYDFLYTHEREYVNKFIKEYNYIQQKYKFKFKYDYIITIEDMLSGVFT
jgi:hypothetical protein